MLENISAVQHSFLTRHNEFPVTSNLFVCTVHETVCDMKSIRRFNVQFNVLFNVQLLRAGFWTNQISLRAGLERVQLTGTCCLSWSQLVRTKNKICIEELVP